jgi:ABC-type multidrug transport system fused ATPase/permease subunit
MLDGVNILDYDTRLLRRRIGLVLQKNHIFRGSIEENIRYGNIGANFAEVEAAARRLTCTTRSKNCRTNTILKRSSFPADSSNASPSRVCF